MKRYLFLVTMVLVAVLSLSVAAQESSVILGADKLDEYPAVLFVTEMLAGQFMDLPSMDVRDQYLAKRFTYSEPGMEDGTVLSFMTSCRTWNLEVPDYAVEVQEVVAAADVVVVRYHVTGTHETYGPFDYAPVAFFYLDGDKVQSAWAMFDRCQQGSGNCEPEQAAPPTCRITHY